MVSNVFELMNLLSVSNGWKKDGRRGEERREGDLLCEWSRTDFGWILILIGMDDHRGWRKYNIHRDITAN
jgi:hypothetical protein